VETTFRERVAPEILEVAVLLTSEAVTNAIIHGRSELEVSLSSPNGGLRVAVTDLSDRWPVVESVREWDERGRGMALIVALADAWGVDAADEGKTVWFTVGQRTT
jgi:anti-sigma regulatory factor (Ser/Thr protein kinase)